MKNLIQKLFPSKKDKDVKALRPYVDSVNEEYEKLRDLTDDELRTRTEDLKARIKEYTAEIVDEIQQLKESAENQANIEEKDKLYQKIDELTKEHYLQLDEVLEELIPEAFAVVKDTARRLTENGELRVSANENDREVAATRNNVIIDGDQAIWKNSWLAADATIDWSMVHYDVQLIGGTVLHSGKIAEMATGEGKTLVATFRYTSMPLREWEFMLLL